MIKALIGARIFDGYQFLDNYAVVLDGEDITQLLPEEQLPADIERLALDGGVLAPGLIDLQVNGGGGVLFNNEPSLAGIKAMLAGHRTAGTTSMTPTLISDTTETLQAGVQAVQDAMSASVKGVLGVHIEGPFFNLSRRGTHKAEYIRPPQDRDLSWIMDAQRASPDMSTLVTLAPEQTQPGQIAALSKAGIRVCAGHTDADHKTIQAALAEGLVGFTHLYNAMRPLTGRDPGVVGAALADRNSWCGIIADGHHVNPVAISVALAAKPAGKLYLVSDAMATVGSAQKSFEIYGETICEENGCLINAEGRLAGSAIGMIDGVKFCVESVGTALEEALRMASLYPAQMIQKSDILGRIRRGYRADLVHFTDEFQVIQTWVAGQHQVHRSTNS
ncbi:N-acetylglucosamine-6-phosphate deacetylase [Aestuariicella hydrocarbonica]|uniref:N-acetylglucosamine-6-phosphate deacetylase n=1 Tax=Pseudomaricurvus hydrocarbonicus TaxID=1470433 RepID=A0A9E5JTI8_9GAMM|nr:N-acetylglucosamine-6-phosphate deacetylase [Aestuariicella hydrocarbonica]NHO65029.1 N-acetylglucosamine-6-phosphate deacetylase [Aestuariicella hydrocarbonica]